MWLRNALRLCKPTTRCDDWPVYACVFKVVSSLQVLRSTSCMHLSALFPRLLHALSLLYSVIYLWPFKDVIGISHRGMVMWLMRDQMDIMWKETIVVCLYVVAVRLPEITEEIHETAGVPAEKRTGHLQSTSRVSSLLYASSVEWKSTNCEAPRCAVFTSLVPFLLFRVQIFLLFRCDRMNWL